MSNVMSIFRGQVSLNEAGVMSVEQSFRGIIELVTREELRPMRELLSAMYVTLQETHYLATGLRIEIDKLPQILEGIGPKTAQQQYTAKGHEGLNSEKTASEVISMLYDEIGEAIPQKLRPFFTDLEAHFRIQLTAEHKRKVEDLASHARGKYPFRKMDTAVEMIGPEQVFNYAKSYKFKKKSYK